MENKYYSEEELIEMFQEGKIGTKEYVVMHSKEWEDEFSDFCRKRNLEQDDKSADMFLDMKDKELEDGEI